MSFIAPVTSTATAASGASATGSSSADAPGGFDPLQHLPSLRSIAAHAIGGAVGGMLGGPMGMLGGAALSVAGAFVEAAIAPGTASASAVSAGSGTPSSRSSVSGTADQASSPSAQSTVGLTLGASSGTAGGPGNDRNLAQRALAALNAYDQTMQNGAVAPGRILA